jgi:hypothetical protein
MLVFRARSREGCRNSKRKQACSGRLNNAQGRLMARWLEHRSSFKIWSMPTAVLSSMVREKERELQEVWLRVPGA